VATPGSQELTGRYLYASLPCLATTRGTALTTASVTVSRSGIAPVTLSCAGPRTALLVAPSRLPWSVTLTGVGTSDQPWAFGLG
jgi:hypothetical protein